MSTIPTIFRVVGNNICSVLNNDVLYINNNDVFSIVNSVVFNVDINDVFDEVFWSVSAITTYLLIKKTNMLPKTLIKKQKIRMGKNYHKARWHAYLGQMLTSFLAKDIECKRKTPAYTRDRHCHLVPKWKNSK